MRFRSLALIPLLGGILGATLALTLPSTAVAEKLPVDCSGRKTSCFERRQCTRYNSDHQCVERTTDFRYWYYNDR